MVVIPGCPGADLTVQRVLEAAALVGVTVRLEQRTVDTVEDAASLGFGGSPTVLVEGVDPFAVAPVVPALACRLYPTPIGPSGAPTVGQLVDALAGVAR